MDDETADLGRARFDHETAAIDRRRDYALTNPHSGASLVQPGRAPRGFESEVSAWNAFHEIDEQHDSRAELKGSLHDGQLHRQNKAASGIPISFDFQPQQAGGFSSGGFNFGGFSSGGPSSGGRGRGRGSGRGRGRASMRGEGSVGQQSVHRLATFDDHHQMGGSIATGRRGRGGHLRPPIDNSTFGGATKGLKKEGPELGPGPKKQPSLAERRRDVGPTPHAVASGPGNGVAPAPNNTPQRFFMPEPLCSAKKHVFHDCFPLAMGYADELDNDMFWNCPIL